MTRRVWVLAFLLSIVALVPNQSRAQAYTKVAPTDPVVHLVTGQGAEVLYFSKASSTGMPAKITVTEAVGKANSIPANDITVGNPVSIQANVFSISIGVATSQFVDPGSPYEAALLLFDSDKTTTPITLKFKIQDDATISFDTTPSTITASVGGSLNPHQRVRVKNTGKAKISSLQMTSSLLFDNANHHSLQMAPHDTAADLLPGQAIDFDFDLPEPLYAGTYAGTLIIIGNHLAEKNLSLTLQTRGPLGNYRIPFILFVLVILLGFYVSSALDAWFASGGLARAEAYISLKNSEKTFAEQVDNLASWRSTFSPDGKPPIDVPKATVWIPQALHELRSSWSTYPDRPIAEMTWEADNFATRAAAANLLWTALQTATSQWRNDPERLRGVCVALDNATLPQTAADVGRYRKDLNDVLVSSAQAVAQGSSIRLEETPAQNGSFLSNLRSKIRRMTALYQAVIWTVVFVTGYLSFYSGHQAFGTLADYLALFLWALGLTSTGTQIITRVHKP
jgi:hypothetical protein